MSQIGTLLTGAGVVTVIAGQSQADQYILIGDADTAPPITAFTVEIDGTPIINIQASQAIIQAFSQWQMETCGTNVGYLLKIATGQIEGNTTYRFTNAGATTPGIFVFSESKNGAPIVATTMSINASSYQPFERFSALFLGTPANVTSLEFAFSDGTKSTMTVAEAAALFNIYNQASTDGYLSAVCVIDNTRQNITSVKVNTGAGACVVLMAKLPDEVFRALNS